ncbi:universal stress protein [Rhizobium wenxiniae]|uniref:universal stress protein n=1 Tax=Rhizobium wenxiniae TaxID=1737357 RepID=UPI003C29FB9C
MTRFEKEGSVENALTEISDAGHDLLITGIEPSAGENGSFSDILNVATTSFSGTSVIVSARNYLPQSRDDLRMLIPVSGTERSLRAAELGLALAKAAGVESALILIEEPRQASVAPRLTDAGGRREDVFSKIDAIANYFEMSPEKVVQQGTSPELAILRHARSASYNLIVLGGSRRAGDSLSYGEVADGLLNAADRSVVFVETERFQSKID